MIYFDIFFRFRTERLCIDISFTAMRGFLPRLLSRCVAVEVIIQSSTYSKLI